MTSWWPFWKLLAYRLVLPPLQIFMGENFPFINNSSENVLNTVITVALLRSQHGDTVTLRSRRLSTTSSWFWPNDRMIILEVLECLRNGQDVGLDTWTSRICAVGRRGANWEKNNARKPWTTEIYPRNIIWQLNFSVHLLSPKKWSPPCFEFPHHKCLSLFFLLVFQELPSLSFPEWFPKFSVMMVLSCTGEHGEVGGAARPGRGLASDHIWVRSTAASAPQPALSKDGKTILQWELLPNCNCYSAILRTEKL